jgi:hypothetical protein
MPPADSASIALPLMRSQSRLTVRAPPARLRASSTHYGAGILVEKHLLEGRLLSDKGEAIMPTDKYTKFILTAIACGLLALVVQNAMGPSDTPVAQSEAAPSNTAASNAAPSNAAPSNKKAREFGKLHLCNSGGCFGIKTCDDGIQHFAGVCADATGNRSTTTQR